jgi:hypothetical protein
MKKTKKGYAYFECPHCKTKITYSKKDEYKANEFIRYHVKICKKEL